MSNSLPEPSMPPQMIYWMMYRSWGIHHLHWHAARRMEHVPQEVHDKLRSMHGMEHAMVQEGQVGSGLDFLAMHRVMIQRLSAVFPTRLKRYLAAWKNVPTDPNQPGDSKPANASPRCFELGKLGALARLKDDLNSFRDDDSLGRYIETSRCSVPPIFQERCPDCERGIHNYLHLRFSSDSPIDMNTFSVNIYNQRFWRLHGWIDRVWSQYRRVTCRGDEAPDYLGALAKQSRHMLSFEDQHTGEEGFGMNIDPNLFKIAPTGADPECRCHD